MFEFSFRLGLRGSGCVLAAGFSPIVGICKDCNT